MASAEIRDGRLVMEGPGVFVVSDPVGETLKVGDGRTRTRKLKAPYTATSEEVDGSIYVALIPEAEEPELEPELELELEPEPTVKVYRRVTDRTGKVLFRTPGPVLFEKREPIEHQAGIGNFESEEAE